MGKCNDCISMLDQTGMCYCDKIKVENSWKFKIFNLTFGREFNQWFARIDANGHMQRIQHGKSLWFCLKKVL